MANAYNTPTPRPPSLTVATPHAQISSTFDEVQDLCNRIYRLESQLVGDSALEESVHDRVIRSGILGALQDKASTTSDSVKTARNALSNIEEFFGL